MSRLSQMKGGGFLNNVDGLLVDYQLTDAFPGAEPTPDAPQIFAVLTVLQDGATDPVQTTLRGGSGAYLAVPVEDSHMAVNPEGGTARIWDKSDLYAFLESVEAAGVPDGGLGPDPAVFEFTSLLGKRMRFVQKPDEGRTEAARKAGKALGREVTKDGKTTLYPFTRLAVETVYAGTTQASPTAVKAPANAGKAVAASTPAVNIDGEAVAVLKKILSANGGSVQRSQLQQNIIRMAAKGEIPTGLREPIRKRIFEESFLLNVEGVVFDQSSKAQTVSLAN